MALHQLDASVCVPLQFMATFYQCVKRELPYEALHVYQKMKQAGSVFVNGKLDLGVCNGLLNVAVGKGLGLDAYCCSWFEQFSPPGVWHASGFVHERSITSVPFEQSIYHWCSQLDVCSSVLCCA